LIYYVFTENKYKKLIERCSFSFAMLIYCPVQQTASVVLCLW